MHRWLKLKVESRRNELSGAQEQMYKLEKVNNFRWVAKHLGKRSNYVLSSKDLTSDALQTKISQIGQFAEVAIYDPDIIWKYLDVLCRPDYPLERYDALREATLLTALRGRIAGAQGHLIFHNPKKRLIATFSGTFNISQAMHDLNAFKVHAGFWRLYRGIRKAVLEALSERLSDVEKALDVEEIVITGHSLGAALSLLLVLDILNPSLFSKMNRLTLHRDISVTTVLFGAPRVGNAAFSRLYRDSVAKFRAERGETKFSELSVKAHNDGVPAVPPLAFGYRHQILSGLYLHHGRLYHIPPSECECSTFSVVHDEDGYGSSEPLHPLGGHNYYNGRNLERTARRMGWIVTTKTKNLGEDWERKYLKRLKKEKLGNHDMNSTSRALEIPGDSDY
ncbi:alpha/beta-hydrolase [Phellopilus nigrolimitatus]|nr:alpha/beta-hydrolase [Phellopilus nigrolimitatus]